MVTRYISTLQWSEMAHTMVAREFWISISLYKSGKKKKKERPKNILLDV